MAASPGDLYSAQLTELEARLETDPALRRKAGRTVYFASVLGAGMYLLCLLGPKLRMSVPKLGVFGYTVNPVAEYAGEQALKLRMDDLLKEGD